MIKRRMLIKIMVEFDCKPDLDTLLVYGLLETRYRCFRLSKL